MNLPHVYRGMVRGGRREEGSEWGTRVYLISFRMDWLDLRAVQGTLKSVFQHRSSKASIFWCSALFTVQLSHPYMTTGKTIALARRNFVGKVMSLLFNILSRLVLASAVQNSPEEGPWENGGGPEVSRLCNS